MTRAEAISELSEMKHDPWTDTQQMEALDMAINILQSIEDIKADLQKEENIWYHDCEHDFSKDFDVIRVDTVLEIIDKHIGKENTDADSD